MKPIVIACGAKKIETKELVQAWKLYTGSLFKTMLLAASYHTDRIYIMSGLYGLIKANDLITTYEYKMSKAKAKYLAENQNYNGNEFISFLPKTYELAFKVEPERLFQRNLRMGYLMQAGKKLQVGEPLINLNHLKDGEIKHKIRIPNE